MRTDELQQLFDALSAPLVLYARQWCAAPDDAVQEAFIDLANSPVAPDRPKAWLYTTTRRKAQNIARAELRRRRHHAQASVGQPQIVQSATVETQSAWFRPTHESLLAEEVARGLESLNGEQREILVARIWGELSFEELATLLGCSLSSAHRRYSNALGALKSILTHACDESSHDVSCTSKSNGRPLQVDIQVETLKHPTAHPTAQPE